MRTPPVSPARLLVVDDHPIVREGLMEVIGRESDMSVVAEADTADAALDILRGTPLDAVIVDLSLPGASGLELIKRIRAEWETLPVLVLSMHEEIIYVERALRAGASGYVMKREGTSAIIRAVRRVTAGEMYVSEDISSKLLQKFIAGGHRGSRSPIGRLSDRELEVFQLIGQGYGTRQIAGMLHLSVKTIESYRANIKEKLNIQAASELVQYAVQWVSVSEGETD